MCILSYAESQWSPFEIVKLLGGFLGSCESETDCGSSSIESENHWSWFEFVKILGGFLGVFRVKLIVRAFREKFCNKVPTFFSFHMFISYNNEDELWNSGTPGIQQFPFLQKIFWCRIKFYGVVFSWMASSIESCSQTLNPSFDIRLKQW